MSRRVVVTTIVRGAAVEDPGGWLPPSESAGPTNPVAQVMAKIGLYPTGGHLVKRVIGIAGDTIVCCDDKGRLSVNGRPLDEGADGPRHARLGDALDVRQLTGSAGRLLEPAHHRELVRGHVVAGLEADPPADPHTGQTEVGRHAGQLLRVVSGGDHR